MKKRNFKIISAITAISLTTALVFNPVLSTAYAEESEAAAASKVNSTVNIELTEGTETGSSTVDPHFKVTNTSTEDIKLEDLNIKYYYTADSNEEQTFNCYYAGTVNTEYRNLTDSVTGKIEKYSPSVPGVDTVLTFGFTDGVLKPGESLEIKTAVNKKDWSSYDKTNDHSYNESRNIVATLNGSMVYGYPLYVEPPKPVKQDAFLSESYFSFDEDTLKDITINLSENCDDVSYINELTHMFAEKLTIDTDYTIDGKTLTLKKEY